MQRAKCQPQKAKDRQDRHHFFFLNLISAERELTLSYSVGLGGFHYGAQP